MPYLARVRAWHRKQSARISERAYALVGQLAKLGLDENTLLLGLAVVIGTAVGLAVIVFYKLIDLVQAA